MEIKVYSLHTSVIENCLGNAFCRKLAIETVWGECAHVTLNFGKRSIEVVCENPNYRVRVHVPFVPVCEIGFDYFATFEDAMKRVEEAYESGFFDVDIEKYRTYQNGARRWVSVG